MAKHEFYSCDSCGRNMSVNEPATSNKIWTGYVQGMGIAMQDGNDLFVISTYKFQTKENGVVNLVHTHLCSDCIKPHLTAGKFQRPKELNDRLEDCCEIDNDDDDDDDDEE